MTATSDASGSAQICTPMPTSESGRIAAIDAVRGLALLGIFFVNIGLFGAAFGSFLEPAPTMDAPFTERVSYYFTKIFCESKVYVLFSALFGMGMVIMTGNAKSRTGRFGWLYARRLLVLMCIGLLHAWLVWYGDILFIYAVGGFVLLIFHFARPRALIIAGSVIILFILVVTASLFTLGQIFAPEKPTQTNSVAAATNTAKPDAATPDAAGADAAPAPSPEPPEPTGDAQPSAEPVPPATDAPKDETKKVEEPIKFLGLGEDSPFLQLIRGLANQEIVTGPQDPKWIAFETQAYHDGPYFELFLFRLMTWTFMIMFVFMGFGWSVIAMFFIGAALMKLGLFEPHRAHWHKRFALLGLFVGLPLAAFAPFAPAILGDFPGMMLDKTLPIIAGPIMALGYLGGMTLLVRSGRLEWLTRALSCAGRMALTNYLFQSLVATTIFYYYGLGLFGETTRFERIGIVLAIYAVQVVLSVLWFKKFTMGPMEWLWRSATYLKTQPMVRRP